MDPKSGKPPPPFMNPFAIWTDLALKTGEAMLASAHALASEATARRIAVIPAADAPAKPEAQAAQAPRSKRANAPGKAKAKARAKARIKARSRR